MSIATKAKALFSKAGIGRAPKLSPYTVKHDQLDEFVYGDIYDRSERFRNAVTNAPMVPQTDEDGTEREVPYDAISDLGADYFFSLYGSDDMPELMEHDEIRPSRHLHKNLMAQAIYAEDFVKTKAMCGGDSVASAFATMAAMGSLSETLQTELKELAERAKDMQDNEDAINDLESQLDQLRQQVKELMANGQGIPDALKQQIKDLAQQKGAAKGALAQQAQQQQQQGFPGVHEAVQKASKDAKDAAEVACSLPGTEAGAGSMTDPSARLELAAKWSQSENLKNIAKLIGRMIRDMSFEYANRVEGGHEIPVDVELGNNIADALPSELVKLRHPALRLDFFKRFREGQLLQMEFVGLESAGMGPMVGVLDASGSMSGAKNEGGRATLLAMLALAHKKKRDCILIDFSSTGQTAAWEFPGKEVIDIERVTDFASHFWGGGTDITTGLELAEETINQRPEFKKADIVLITDGSDTLAEDDLLLRERLRSKGVRMHGVTVGMPNTPYTDEMCDTTISVADLTATDTAKHIGAHFA